MKTKLIAIALVCVLFSAPLLNASDYYGFRHENRTGSNPRMSDTEKAIAGLAIGALAFAAARSARKHNNQQAVQLPSPPPARPPATQLPLQPPPSWRPGYNQSNNVVVVNIRRADGQIVPIILQRTPTGFVGPQGEYYPTMPSVQQLTNTYGGIRRPAYAAQPLRVSVLQGQVQVTQGGRTVAILRPALPNVERYKLVNDNREIIIKSRGNHGPAMVEKFHLSNGALNDKVMAFAIRNSGATWAYGFED